VHLGRSALPCSDNAATRRARCTPREPGVPERVPRTITPGTRLLANEQPNTARVAEPFASTTAASPTRSVQPVEPGRGAGQPKRASTISHARLGVISQQRSDEASAFLFRALAQPGRERRKRDPARAKSAISRMSLSGARTSSSTSDSRFVRRRRAALLRSQDGLLRIPRGMSRASGACRTRTRESARTLGSPRFDQHPARLGKLDRRRGRAAVRLRGRARARSGYASDQRGRARRTCCSSGRAAPRRRWRTSRAAPSREVRRSARALRSDPSSPPSVHHCSRARRRYSSGDQSPLDQDVADGAEHRQDLRLPRVSLRSSCSSRATSAAKSDE